GLLHPVAPDAPQFFSGWPLGAALPGRKISATGSWFGLLRAAHCDELKTEYRFVTNGERMRIEGRSTTEEEERHKIRARVEATYLPTQGIVSEGRIEFDFSPLGSDRRIIIRCSISRS
ncbi:MAG: hypothetical protein HY293_14870, partial [Planctomycetes bacterium]|nr:hypothetical protein [Planctomycetota bacterium]